MKALVFDCEIRRAIADPGATRDVNLHYCAGWHDFANMGISCITAVETPSMRPYLFLEDNLWEFPSLLAEYDWSVGFNSVAFDLPLLEVYGLQVPRDKHFDLAREVWRSAGVPDGEHPKGLGLNALCEAAGLPGKIANGAQAPLWYQTEQFGRLGHYCLADSYATARLFNRAMRVGGLEDPRPQKEWHRGQRWIQVAMMI